MAITEEEINTELSRQQKVKDIAVIHKDQDTTKLRNTLKRHFFKFTMSYNSYVNMITVNAEMKVNKYWDLDGYVLNDITSNNYHIAKINVTNHNPDGTTVTIVLEKTIKEPTKK